MRFWGGVSAALHAALLLLLVLFALPRDMPEPQEAAIPIEILSDASAQFAQGERPAPVPGPVSAEPPARPEPRQTRPNPAPPPPPPPPAPRAEPAPRPAEPRPVPPAPPTPSQQAQPRPSPPAPPPDPGPGIRPPPPPPKPQVAEAKPRPEPPPPVPPKAPAPPAPAAPRPAPQPSPQAGTGQTPPVKKPEANSSSVLNTLERLQQTTRGNEPPRGAPANAPARSASGGGAPGGAAPLTSGEKGVLANRISECWSVDAGGQGISSIVVSLRVDVDAGGTVRNVRPDGGYPSDPRARAVYDAARRALLDPRCNPLPLQRERLAALRETVFRFNPREFGLR